MSVLKKLSFLAVLLVVSPLSHGAELTEGPVAVLPAPSFEFSPVADGSEVIHDFIIRNAGSAVLDILEIKSG